MTEILVYVWGAMLQTIIGGAGWAVVLLAILMVAHLWRERS